MKIKNKNVVIILVSLIFVTQMTIKLGISSENRSTSLSTPYPRIEITGTQKIKAEIKISNEGELAETFDIIINGPETWEPKITSGEYIIKSIYLDKNESRELNFRASPPSNEKSGNYTFEIIVTSQDKLLKSSLKLSVELIGITAQSEITMSTPYPSLEGTSTQQYEFRVTMWNSGSEDRIVELSALHPQGWKMVFNPLFEDRIINSLEFKAGERQDVMIRVTPAPDVAPGNYDITIFGTSGELIGEINLNINLVGIHSLRVITPDGLVSFDSIQGKSSQITLNLENTGTAPLENLHFSASKPLGWEVNFEPNNIAVLNPSTLYEVRANIIPPSDAIPGDYVLSLTSIADPWISESLHFRTTVRGSVSWGFIGLGFIAVLAIIIFAIFRYFGRR